MFVSGTGELCFCFCLHSRLFAFHVVSDPQIRLFTLPKTTRRYMGYYYSFQLWKQFVIGAMFVFGQIGRNFLFAEMESFQLRHHLLKTFFVLCPWKAERVGCKQRNGSRPGRCNTIQTTVRFEINIYRRL